MALATTFQRTFSRIRPQFERDHVVSKNQPTIGTYQIMAKKKVRGIWSDWFVPNVADDLFAGLYSTTWETEEEAQAAIHLWHLSIWDDNPNSIVFQNVCLQITKAIQATT